MRFLTSFALWRGYRKRLGNSLRHLCSFKRLDEVRRLLMVIVVVRKSVEAGYILNRVQIFQGNLGRLLLCLKLVVLKNVSRVD